jgi:Reverse transcriptase (RNA-dependent DNA polymerase)
MHAYYQKSLYDLKQSPRVWFQKLSESLVSFGFAATNYDPFLFISHSNGQTILLLIYMDDIIVTSSDVSLMNSCINYL